MGSVLKCADVCLCLCVLSVIEAECPFVIVCTLAMYVLQSQIYWVEKYVSNKYEYCLPGKWSLRQIFVGERVCMECSSVCVCVWWGPYLLYAL